MPVYYSDIQISIDETIQTPSQSGFVKLIYKDGTIKTIDSSGTENNIQSVPFGLITVNSNYSILSSDNTILCNCQSGQIILTLPLSNIGQGRIYNIKKIDSSRNTIRVNCQLSEKIDGKSFKLIKGQYTSMQIQSDGNNWWIL